MSAVDDDDLWSDVVAPPEPPEGFFDGPDAEPSHEEPVPPRLRIVRADAKPATPTMPAWQRHGTVTVADMIQRVHERCKRGVVERGLTTGVGEIDRLIGGYRARHVTVLGAATSFGKTTFAIMAFDEADRIGKRALIVSGEDDEVMYGKRLAARRTGISALALRDEQLTPDDEARLFVCGASASLMRGFLYGVGKSAEQLAAAIVELCAEEHYDLVVIDYVQAFAAKAQDRRNEVAKVTSLFRDAIKVSGAAGLMLSQIRRLETGKEPSMHDLKEAGDIENMAEHVIIGGTRKLSGDDPFEDAKGPLKRWLRLDKNKDGPKTGERVWLNFDDETASFRRQE